MDTPEFEVFLDQVECVMRTPPQEQSDGRPLDAVRLSDDLQQFTDHNNGETKVQRLKALILKRQEELPAGLTPDRLEGFENYPRFTQLTDMATKGVQPFLKDNFIPNKGDGDFARTPQYRRLGGIIIKHLRKLQDKGRIIMLPRADVIGMEGLHVSALHITPNAGGDKWRVCVDATQSGLNEGTDMEAMLTYLGEHTMPKLQDVARMVYRAHHRPSGVLHKTDVSQAFNNMLLDTTTAFLQAFQVEDYVVIPVVSGFGWAGAPAHYNIIAGAIHWGHNGGISVLQIELWNTALGWSNVVRPDDMEWQQTDRSITYVDDSIGQASILSCERDMADLKTLAVRLMGKPAYNAEKTEGPSTNINVLGWQCDVPTGTVRPSKKGMCKIHYWIFRGLKNDRIKVKDMQKAVGVLRWYSSVIPMASTRELQRVLNRAEVIQENQPNKVVHMCNLTAAARREIQWWQWLLRANFGEDMLITPAWFIAKLIDERERVTIYTDACTTIGGGYIWHDHSYGATKWCDIEKQAFGTLTQPTDINGLELITAICAIIQERHQLEGKLVHLRVDNTAAVAWLNKTRSSQLWGQAWMRMLVAVLLQHDILLTCTHIPGQKNICADLLSRDIQTPELEEAIHGLTKKQLLSAESRVKIWTMPLTAHSPQEYLSILNELETQDTESSRKSAQKSSGGPNLTLPEKTPSST